MQFALQISTYAGKLHCWMIMGLLDDAAAQKNIDTQVQKCLGCFYPHITDAYL